MKNIKIELLSPHHIPALFAFEQANRDYYRKIGLERDPSYYEEKSYELAQLDLISQQKDGTYCAYAVLVECGEVVGRVSFSNIVYGQFQKAELGYRIGEAHQNQGFATAAVGLAIEDFRLRHKLHRLEAGTNADNIASQIVLLKNCFQFCGRQNSCYFQNGKWHDSLMFQRILDE